MFHRVGDDILCRHNVTILNLQIYTKYFKWHVRVVKIMRIAFVVSNIYY